MVPLQDLAELRLRQHEDGKTALLILGSLAGAAVVVTAVVVLAREVPWAYYGR